MKDEWASILIFKMSITFNKFIIRDGVYSESRAMANSAKLKVVLSHPKIIVVENFDRLGHESGEANLMEESFNFSFIAGLHHQHSYSFLFRPQSLSNHVWHEKGAVSLVSDFSVQ